MTSPEGQPICAYFQIVDGEVEKEHPVCQVDVLDGEFGSHDTECPSQGKEEGCKYPSTPTICRNCLKPTMAIGTSGRE